jgi:hypothetical protein
MRWKAPGDDAELGVDYLADLRNDWKEPPLFSSRVIRQSGHGVGGTYTPIFGEDPMNLRPRKTSWFVSGLLLVTLMSAGFELAVAQPKGEASRPALDKSEATFEEFGDHISVNISNITYTSDEGQLFDIYFACSSTRGEDPLRLTDARDIGKAQSYFNDEKRSGKHFLKINKYHINPRTIAYITSTDASLVVHFNARISDAFVKLTLSGADAESFRKKIREP